MATKHHSSRKAARDGRSHITPPTITRHPRHGLVVSLRAAHPASTSDRLGAVKTLIEAAQLVNDRELSPSILRVARSLIDGALEQFAGGAP